MLQGGITIRFMVEDIRGMLEVECVSSGWGIECTACCGSGVGHSKNFQAVIG